MNHALKINFFIRHGVNIDLQKFNEVEVISIQYNLQ